MSSAAAAGTPVGGALATVTIVLSLIVAAWSLISTLRKLAPDRTHLIGLAVVELALLALIVNAIAGWAGGDGPAEAETFLGYLVTIVCLPPLGAVLARMEPTRWGSLVVTVVCVVVPVLVLRLQQTWLGPGV